MKNIHDKGSKFKKEKLEPTTNHKFYAFTASCLDTPKTQEIIAEMLELLNSGWNIISTLTVGEIVIYIIKS